jgi:uncharacterized RDD family membrane protein YckC
VTLDHRYTVDTPENITFDYELAGIGTRFLAATLDSTLIILLQGLLWVGLGLLAGLLEGIVRVPSSIIVAIGSILSFAFLWGYYLYFELLWNGQSPGKRLLRLRVVQTGGRPITFNAAAIRNLVRLIDFLPFFYGVGVLTMFVDGQARRLGDLAAGTLVVKEAQPISLQMLLQPPTPASPPALPPIPPQFAHVPLLAQIQAVQPEDYALVQAFLHRRRLLSQHSRNELAAQLATTLSARLQLAVQPQHYEQFLERVELDYRRGQVQREV